MSNQKKILVAFVSICGISTILIASYMYFQGEPLSSLYIQFSLGFSSLALAPYISQLKK